MGSSKLKTFVYQRTLNEKINPQNERIFASHISDVRLTSRLTQQQKTPISAHFNNTYPKIGMIEKISITSA